MPTFYIKLSDNAFDKTLLPEDKFQEDELEENLLPEKPLENKYILDDRVKFVIVDE